MRDTKRRNRKRSIEKIGNIIKVLLTLILLLQVMPNVSITTQAKENEVNREALVEQVGLADNFIYQDNSKLPRGGSNDAEVPPLISAVKMVDAVGLLTAGAALDAAGGVWMWGYNAYGVQGLGIDQGAGGTARYNGGFKRVQYFVENNIKIVKIWGAYHTMYALSDTGELYAWGYGGTGQMGNGTSTTHNNAPVKVSFPKGEKIKNLYISSRYADAYSAIYTTTESGKVYFWGYASYRTEGSVNPYASSDTTNKPTEVAVLTTLNQQSEIVSIGPGARHAVFVTADGKVYTWGYNYSGAIGIPTVTTFVNTLTEVPYFTSNNIKAVATSVFNNATLILSDKGDVYQYGEIFGTGYQTESTLNFVKTPQKVEIDQTSASYTPVFTQIEAGYTTYLAVDQHGRVWAWGSNAYYQFGSDGSLFGAAAGSPFNYTNIQNGKFLHMLKKATQIPQVLGDGDTQSGSSSVAKGPVFSGVPSSTALNNALGNYQDSGMWSDVADGDGKHPTIYDKKYYITNKEPANITAAQPTAIQMRNAHATVYMMDSEGRNLVYVVRKEASGTLSGNFYVAEAGYSGSWFVNYSTSTGLPSGVTAETSLPQVKDSEKDWIELSTGGQPNNFTGNQNAKLPYMSTVAAGKETVIYLDKSGNIYVSALTGSGGVAWGWDYVAAYDWTGSTHNYGDGNGIVARHDKDGLFDYYNYEIMYQRGMPRLSPMYSVIESTKEKIYINENNEQVDTLIVTTKLPPIFSDSDLNLTYTPELRSIQYIVIPYDLDDENFNREITPEIFAQLYASETYAKGELVDSPVLSTENASEIEHELEIRANGRIVVMVTGFSYSAETQTISSHYADNFYTPAVITHSGNGYVDDEIYEGIYQNSSVNVIKTVSPDDPAGSENTYGFPLDANGNVIENATFGYDVVTVSKYDVLPNGQDKYWQLMTGQDASVTFTLDKNETDVLASLAYDHEFKYERNPSGWVTISYEGYYYGTSTAATGFAMTPNPEIVKIDIELTRTPTALSNYDNLGYYVDNGTTLNALVSGNMVYTPIADTVIKFQYATYQSNGEKQVVDDNDNGYAEPGELLHYTLTYTNEGYGVYENLLVRDELTGIIDYITETSSVVVNVVYADGSTGTKTLAELQAGFNAGNVGANQSVVVTFSLKLISDLDISTVDNLTNTAKLGDTDPTTDIDTGSINLSGTKTVSKETAEPGDILTYVLTLRNDGNIQITGQTIKDELTNVLPYITESAEEISVVVNSNKDSNKNQTITGTELIAGLSYTVAGGEVITVTFSVTIKDKEDLDLTDSITIANSAVVGSDNPSTETEVEASDVIGTKTVSKETAEPGDTLTYVLTLKNDGNVKSDNQSIKDELTNVLPYIVENASQISVAITSNKDVFKNRLTTATELISELSYSVAAGEVITITFNVTIKDKEDLDLTNAITIANSAVVGEDNPSTETEIEATDVSGTKTVSKETAGPGDTLTYVLTLTNSGNTKAENQTIKDELTNVLPYITELASQINVTVSSNKDASKNQTKTGTDLAAGLTYDVEAGEIITVTFNVTIKDKEDLDLTSPITIANSAVIGEDNPGTETEIEATDVSGTKTVSKETAEPGDTLTYTLTLSNAGNITAENQSIKDEMTNLLPYIVENAAGISVNITSNKDASKNETKTGTDLVAGLTYNVAAGETITVIFNVTIKDKEDLDLTNPITIANSAVVGEDNPGTETEVETTDLSGTKTVSKETAEPGDTLTYVLTLTNSGNTKAENQTIKDELTNVLPYITELASQINVTVSSNKDASRNQTKAGTELISGLTYNVAAGEIITVTFDVTIKDKEDLDLTNPITIANSAVVGEDEPGTETEVETTDVSGTKAVSKETAEPGDTLTYTLTLKNDGNIKAENQMIKDELTNVLPYIVEEATGISVAIVSNKDTTKNETLTGTELITGLTYEVGAGETITVTFSVTIKDKDDLDLTNSITIANSAVVGEDNPSTETEVESSDLTGTKTVSKETAEPGDTLTYTLSLTNSGNTQSENQMIQDGLSNVLPYIMESASGISVTVTSNKDLTKNKTVTGIELMLGLTFDVLVDETITVSFNVTIKDKEDLDLTNPITIANSAVVGEDNPSTETEVESTDVSGTKTVSKVKAGPGDSLVYTLTLKNEGNITAENQSIKDEMTNLLPYIVESANEISVVVESNLDISKNETLTGSQLIAGLTYNVGAGEIITVTFGVTIKEKEDLDLTNSITIANSAIVGEDEPGTETEVDLVDLIGSKSVTDTDGDNLASPSEVLTYVIRVDNNGTIAGTNVTIKDTLEALGTNVVYNDSDVVTIVNTTTGAVIQTANIAELKTGIVIPSIGAKAYVTVSFTVTVAPTLDVESVTSLANLATVNDVPATSTIDTGDVDLSGTKTVSKETAGPGDTLTYTLTLSNNGAVATENQTIKDELTNVLPYIVESASEISVVVASNKESAKNQTVSGTQLVSGLTYDVEAGETITATFSVTIKNQADLDLTNPITIENSAVVGEDNPSTETEVEASDVIGTKTVSKEVAEPGDTLIYTLTLKNEGNVKAENQTIKDELTNVLPYIVESADEISVVVTSNSDTSKNQTISATQLISGLTYEVAAGEIITVTFNVTIKDKDDLDLTNSITIANSAVIGGDNPGTETEIESADLSGSKTVSKETAEPGDTLTYTLTLRNGGNTKAENQTIKDELTNVLPYIVETSGEISVTVESDKDSNKNQVITGTDLIAGLTYDVAIGERITVRFDVTVKDKEDLDLTNSITIANSAVVGEDNPSTETEVESSDLTGSKTVSKETAAPRDTLTYTLTLSNSGNATATNQMIQDQLVNVLPHIVETANEIAVTVTSNTDTTKNQTLTGTELVAGLVYDVAANETINVSFSVTVKAKDDLNLTTPITIANSAIVGEDRPTTETGVESTDLTGTKAVSDANKDGKASPGEVLTYTLILKNEGNIQAVNQVIQDELLTVLPHIIESLDEIAVTVTSNTDTGKNQTVTGTQLASGLTYNVAAGEIITVVFNVTVDDIDLDLVDQIGNLATVGKDKPSITIPTGDAILVGTKTVSKEEVEPGEILSYTLTLSNNGDVAAENQTISDDLTNVLAHIVESPSEIAVSISSNTDATKDQTLTAVELISGLTYDVAADETITVTFSVTIKSKTDLGDVSTIANSAIVGDDNPGTETEILVAKMAGTKVVSAPKVAPGDVVTYTLTLNNSGNLKAENQTIQDQLINVLPYIVETADEISVAVTSNKDTSKNQTVTGTELIAGLIYDVEAGETITVTFGVTIRDKEDLDLTSSITIENSAVVGEDNPSAETEVESSDLTGTKVASAEKVAPGDTLTYTLTLSNSGNAKAENKLIQDQMIDLLPYIVEAADEISVAVTSNKDTSKNQTVTGTELIVGLTYDVEAGETITVTFDVTIDPDLNVKTTTVIENSAVVGDDNPGTSTETGAADLVGTKTVKDANNDKKASPGEVLTYTLTLTNNGTVDAENQTIRDEMLALLPYIVEAADEISVVVTSNKDTSKNETLTGSQLIAGLTYDVEAGETITVVFNVTIDPDLDVKSTVAISNSAIVGDDNPGTSTETGAPDLVGTKTVLDTDGDGKASANEELTYTLTLTNNGTVKAENQMIKDELTTLFDYVNDPRDNIVTINHAGAISTKTVADLMSGLTFDVGAKETITVKFSVTVIANLDTDTVTEIKNTAVVGEDNPSTTTETKKPQIVTLRYFSNCGGDPSTKNVPTEVYEFKVGDSVNVHDLVPTRDNYEFVNWQAQVALARTFTGATHNPSDSFVITNHTELYAQWKEKPSEPSNPGIIVEVIPPSTGVSNDILLYGLGILASGILLITSEKRVKKDEQLQD